MYNVLVYNVLMYNVLMYNVLICYALGMSIPIKDVADAMVGSLFDDSTGIIDNRSIVAKAAALKAQAPQQTSGGN